MDTVTGKAPADATSQEGRHDVDAPVSPTAGDTQTTKVHAFDHGRTGNVATPAGR